MMLQPVLFILLLVLSSLIVSFLNVVVLLNGLPADRVNFRYKIQYETSHSENSFENSGDPVLLKGGGLIAAFRALALTPAATATAVLGTKTGAFKA